MTIQEKIAVTDTLTVADFFRTKGEMTHKKLQKLIYYAYAWFITVYNENSDDIINVLTEEQPEAWVHGPVFRTVYDKFKYSSWCIPKLDNPELNLSQEVINFLEQIWDVFGKYDGDQLEFMTHHETPWIEARGNISPMSSSSVRLNDKTIFNFYSTVS